MKNNMHKLQYVNKLQFLKYNYYIVRSSCGLSQRSLVISNKAYYTEFGRVTCTSGHRVIPYKNIKKFFSFEVLLSKKLSLNTSSIQI